MKTKNNSQEYINKIIHKKDVKKYFINNALYGQKLTDDIFQNTLPSDIKIFQIITKNILCEIIK
ncbi:MAG: hypothetical protein ACOZBL_03355 [Patescibacteria group bacterium]